MAKKPQMPSTEVIQHCFSCYSHPSLHQDSTSAAPEPWLRGQIFFFPPTLFIHVIPAYFPVPAPELNSAFWNLASPHHLPK